MEIHDAQRSRGDMNTTISQTAEGWSAVSTGCTSKYANYSYTFKIVPEQLKFSATNSCSLVLKSTGKPRAKKGSQEDDTTRKQTLWPEPTSELHRPSDHRLSAKFVPTFADKWVSRSQRGGSLGPQSLISWPKPLLFISKYLLSCTHETHYFSEDDTAEEIRVTGSLLRKWC
jgi:hypothetical protein